MKNFVEFFHQIGKLKGNPRRGWVINDIKNPESIAEHTFRAAVMAWLLAEKKKLNVEKVLKIALIHDICEVYAGDTTPYDSILPKSKKKRAELLKTWPRFSNAEKKRLAKEKHERERKCLDLLILDLPADTKKEIKKLWLDYENGLTPEGRFFKQMDRLEDFLQSMEYWQKHGKPPQGPWWLWAREHFHDPLLLEIIKEMDKKFHKKKKPRA
jgi:putative hydrolase of HD superfamily